MEDVKRKLNARDSRLILGTVERAMNEAEPNKPGLVVIECTTDKLFVHQALQTMRTVTLSDQDEKP